jgi:hypothetical protein
MRAAEELTNDATSEEAITEPPETDFPPVAEAGPAVPLEEPEAKGSWVRRIPLLRIFAAPDIEPAQTLLESGEWPPYAEQGTRLRLSERAARNGFYAPAFQGAPTTTRQAEILNTALIAAPTGVEGVAAGRDVLSQTAISKDPITDYNSTPRRITSTNVLVVGDVGAGKSAYTKTVYVMRPLILRHRRAVVFDKKNERGEGEYSPIVREFNGDHIKFAMDGTGVIFNILDPAISGVNDDGLNNQLVYLNTIPALMRDGNGPNEWERKALRLAYREMMKKFEGTRTPTTADLHDLLGIIDRHDPSLDGMSGQTLEQLHRSGISMRFCFNELLETYGAIFDGETSADVRLNRKLTSFDISQLPDTGPAIPMVMGLANLWLLGTVRRPENRGIRTNVINEEAGHILGGPLAIQQRSNIKLSRGLGLSNIYNIHKGATDVPAGSPGMAVIEEAQTVHIFRQDKPEAAQWCVRTFGLNPESANDIMVLRNGHHLLKSGADVPEVEIEHVRSAWEVRMTDTDSALRETDSAYADLA